MRIAAHCIFITIAALSFSGAFAQSAKVAVVLVPGAGGAIPSDCLIRNEKAFACHGLQTKLANVGWRSGRGPRTPFGKAAARPSSSE
jgi:predicted alpha/beta-hydrolase family hydrolase